jgi:hypothetical protein
MNHIRVPSWWCIIVPLLMASQIAESTNAHGSVDAIVPEVNMVQYSPQARVVRQSSPQSGSLKSLEKRNLEGALAVARDAALLNSKALTRELDGVKVEGKDAPRNSRKPPRSYITIQAAPVTEESESRARAEAGASQKKRLEASERKRIEAEAAADAKTENTDLKKAEAVDRELEDFMSSSHTHHSTIEAPHLVSGLVGASLRVKSVGDDGESEKKLAAETGMEKKLMAEAVVEMKPAAEGVAAKAATKATKAVKDAPAAADVSESGRQRIRTAEWQHKMNLKVLKAVGKRYQMDDDMGLIGEVSPLTLKGSE